MYMHTKVLLYQLVKVHKLNQQIKMVNYFLHDDSLYDVVFLLVQMVVIVLD